jgi:hypothetical protein
MFNAIHLLLFIFLVWLSRHMLETGKWNPKESRMDWWFSYINPLIPLTFFIIDIFR